MFFDPSAWPSPPDGPPSPPTRRISPAEEQILIRLVGLFLLMLVIGPLCGSSLVDAAVAVTHTALAAIQ